MTEAEWHAGDDPVALLAHLNCPPNTRKHRLYAVGCCRAGGQLFAAPEVQAAIDWAERFADGAAAYDGEFDHIRWHVEGLAYGLADAAADPAPGVRSLSGAATWFAYCEMIYDQLRPRDPSFRKTPRFLSVPLLRDVFGNPFAPVAFDPGWRTEAVVGLARGMYETRDFAPMPVLADALESAGCAAADILAHCRGNGPHVRGCWVVDLVLGKA
jgi:hypothetical protein